MSSGLEITKLNNPAELDKDKLEALIEDGFGKSLIPDYFTGFSPEAVYIAQIGAKYNGAIVLERTELGIAYLDKFVVSKDYQNNGIGGKLWSEAVKNEKRIFWRAKPENPINKFYMSVCDGMQKADGWHVFWVGLDSDEIKKAIKYALSKRETLAKPSTS